MEGLLEGLSGTVLAGPAHRQVPEGCVRTLEPDGQTGERAALLSLVQPGRGSKPNQVMEGSRQCLVTVVSNRDQEKRNQPSRHASVPGQDRVSASQEATS